MDIAKNIKWAWKKIKRMPSWDCIYWDLQNSFNFYFKRSRENVAFLTNFPVWKRPFVAQFLKFQGFSAVYFLNLNGSARKVRYFLHQQVNPTVIVWGMRNNQHLLDFAAANDVPVWRMEDGFVRSVGLGAKQIRPLSLVLDKSGWLYFDATHANELETFLATHHFSNQELNEAREVIDKILRQQITKYNLQENDHYEFSTQPGRKVLVIGQCEDDASIVYGSPHLRLNTELILKALEENQDATIYFRPHPDVTSGLREALSDVYSVSPDVVILDQPLDLWGNIQHFDAIYVMTSLAGFEAALRGCEVHVFGHPFYSGWGVTNDRYPHVRRDRKHSLEAVFYAAYMHIPYYLHPETTAAISLGDAIDILEDQRKQK